MDDGRDYKIMGYIFTECKEITKYWNARYFARDISGNTKYLATLLPLHST